MYSKHFSLITMDYGEAKFKIILTPRKTLKNILDLSRPLAQVFISTPETTFTIEKPCVKYVFSKAGYDVGVF